MTEIDVPDWVVKAAEDARVRCLNAVTAYGSAGVDERYHMAMKAALTAALGAWVGPLIRAAEEEAGRRPLSTHKLRAALAALRQEKPE